MRYGFLNLPAPTTDWGVGFKEIGQYNGFNPDKKLTTVLPNGETQGIAVYERVRANFKYKAWLYSIVPELKEDRCEIGFQRIINKTNHPNGAVLLPHSDGLRGPFVLSYNFDVGGANCPTVYWQEEGHPINREQGLQTNFKPNFNQIDSVVFKSGTWNVLDARPLHSVHNVETVRFAFTVGFYREDLFELIKQKYSLH